MASSNDRADPATASTDSTKLDIQVLNNGVKLVGEALVPGASLLLEKQISAGLVVGTLGVLGGAALGSAFGPLGYVLARYGASAVSFSQSVQDPPAKNGATTTEVVEAVGQVFAKKMPEIVNAAVGEAVVRTARAQPPAFTSSAAPVDLAKHIADAATRTEVALEKFAAAIADLTQVVSRSAAVGRSAAVSRSAPRRATPA